VAQSSAAPLPDFARWRREWLNAGRDQAPLLAAAGAGGIPGRGAAALRGLDELDRLNDIAQRAAVLAASGRKSSSLGRVMELALRRPVVTAPLLARELDLTHQGALLLLNRLVAEGLLREATGRKSFRAFVAV